MRNEAYWRYQVYRDRVARSLGDRYPVRLHMSILVVVAIIAGFAADALLVAAGSKSMLSRYPFAILAGHASFLAGVHFWLAHSGVAELINRKKAHLLVGDDVAPPEPWKPGSESGAGAGVAVSGDPAMLVYVLGFLMALSVVFLALGGWALLVAPSIFGDAVLARMRGARLLAGVDTVEGSGWMTTVLRHTGFTLAFGLVVAVAIGWYAKIEAPKANSLMELF